MKKNTLIAIIGLSLASLTLLTQCKKPPLTSEVIDLEPKSLSTIDIPADDSTRTTLWADIPWESSGSTIVFTSRFGRFVSGTAVIDGGSTISVPASISGHTSGKWSAPATYISPNTVTGYDTITAYIDGQVPRYIDTLYIRLGSSAPASITLSSSVPSVSVPYVSTATITGILANSKGAKVSRGTPVSFTLLLAGVPVSGQFFFPATAYSDGSSTVTTVFNPGTLAPDSMVYTIVGSVGAGGAAGIADSVHVFVTQ